MWRGKGKNMNCKKWLVKLNNDSTEISMFQNIKFNSFSPPHPPPFPSLCDRHTNKHRHALKKHPCLDQCHSLFNFPKSFFFFPIRRKYLLRMYDGIEVFRGREKKKKGRFIKPITLVHDAIQLLDPKSHTTWKRLSLIFLRCARGSRGRLTDVLNLLYFLHHQLLYVQHHKNPICHCKHVAADKEPNNQVRFQITQKQGTK